MLAPHLMIIPRLISLILCLMHRIPCTIDLYSQYFVELALSALFYNFYNSQNMILLLFKGYIVGVSHLKVVVNWLDDAIK